MNKVNWRTNKQEGPVTFSLFGLYLARTEWCEGEVKQLFFFSVKGKLKFNLDRYQEKSSTIDTTTNKYLKKKKKKRNQI